MILPMTRTIFPTLEQGRAAAMALRQLKATNGVEYPGYPAGTLANVVRQLSPSSENATEDMIARISRKTGLDRNLTYQSLTPEQKQAFALAYEREEGLFQLPPLPEGKVR